MARTADEVMSGLVTLSVIERRKPNELILGVNLTTKKATTYYDEMVGSLRLHYKASAAARVQRAYLYALTGDVYYGLVHHGEFVYGVFKKID